MQKTTTLGQPYSQRTSETHKKPPKLSRSERAAMTPDQLQAHKRAYWRWRAHQRYLKNPEGVRRNKQQSRARNREHVRAQAAEGERRRYANNPQVRLKSHHTTLLSSVLRDTAGEKAVVRFEDAVGCTVAEFKSHLESLFVDGMSWENRGRHGWHVDHIRPLSSFDLTIPSQRSEAYHFTNTQPLWADANRRKMISDQTPVDG